MEYLSNEAMYILRVVIAMFCGIIIGYERENRNKQAGLKTHALVALGAAVATIVSKYGFFDVKEYDAARVAAQIISGVGFLGAGVIFVKAKIAIEGLTTAAGLWATSAISMSISSGLIAVGIFSTIMIVTFQILTHGNVAKNRFSKLRQIVFEVSGDYDSIQNLEKELLSLGAIFIYREVKENRVQEHGINVEILIDAPLEINFDTIHKLVNNHKNIYKYSLKSYVRQ